ncbi:MAPEG family protein [Mesorhizobium sp. CAU 1741]|uniref:MAPEG family protein n=1 Tax=Mesorhizobium sp. CAU 1741 TaxID=3140366 RepID=UPI00325AD199
MMAHVLLVFIIYAMLGLRRKAAVTSGNAKVSQFRENQVEPQQSLFVKNALANQFELPMLFHIACLSLYATGGADIVALVLAWLFAISRYVHTFIHVTSNRIRYRQPAFVAGFVIVLVLWVMIAIHLLSA